MEITRQWCMPSKNTFEMKPVNDLIKKHFKIKMKTVDPFANTSRIATITNDLDPLAKADYCMDALEFLKTFGDQSVDGVLFDPPYSPRQVSESYRQLKKSVNMQTTQASFWSNLKKEIARIVKPRGVVLSCGWNSQGIGKSRGFEIKEILLVCHGGNHNDTICTIETKALTLLDYLHF